MDDLNSIPPIFAPGTRVRRRTDRSDTGVVMGSAFRKADVLKIRWDDPDGMTYIGAHLLEIVGDRRSA